MIEASEHGRAEPCEGSPTASMGQQERLTAALSHLGVPLFGLVLPLVIWSTVATGSVVRTHARQAFTFQIIFMMMWVVLVGLMFAEVLDDAVLMLALAIALGLELPQVARAIRGKAPCRVLPPVLPA